MALQTSGAISLNDIHVEAGGTTGTSASINDTDIRDLIGKSSGAQSSFSEFYGASAIQPFASWTSSFGSVTTTTSGKITISSAPYTNPNIPLRGGYTHVVPTAVVGSNNVGINLPNVYSTLAQAQNPFYQMYDTLGLTHLATTSGTDIIGSPVTYSYWALDPLDFGYQSVTMNGLTCTFHKATASDVPPVDNLGTVIAINGLAIQRWTSTSADRWGVNLAGTVTGTSTDGTYFTQGQGFTTGTSIVGQTVTLNGYP